MRLPGKISTALLLLVYVAAFAGFRLHECSVDHSVEVLVLAGDRCEDVHHHDCGDQEHCGHRHHHCAEDHEAQESAAAGAQLTEADCCSNSLHCVSDAQIASDGGSDSMAQKCLQPAMTEVPAWCYATPCGEASAPAYCQESLCTTGRTALALYSVRRV